MNSIRTLPLALLSLLSLLQYSGAQAIPEAHFRDGFAAQILPFLRTGQTFRFTGARGVLLAGIHFRHLEPTGRGTIVVIPGRSEPYLKYAEVMHDLYQQGYDLFSYDHRGQGLSPHLSSHRAQIGHLDSFQYYIEDLHTFTQTQVRPDARGPFYLLAHSMGAGIALRYLIEHPGAYTRAALVAPMLEIVTAPYPKPIARAIVAGAVKLGFGNRYAPGRGDYVYDIPIEESTVTHSHARAWMWDELTRAHPETAIGGPSNKWVLDAIRESAVTLSLMDQLQTPTLMLQAGKDSYVKPWAQQRGCERAPQCTLRAFTEARHEILMEIDSIRDLAMREIAQFF